MRWFLHARPEGIDVPAEVARFAAVVGELAPRVPDLAVGVDREVVLREAAEYEAQGVGADEALRTAALLSVYPLLDVAEVAAASGRAPADVAATWFTISERYGIDALLTSISLLERTDRWQALARAALRDDLYSALRDLTAAVHAHAAEAAGAGESWDAAAAVAAWEEAHGPAVRRARTTMQEIEASDRADLASLSVGLRVLRTVLRNG